MLICRKPKIFDVDLYGLAIIMGIWALSWLLVVRPVDRKLQHIRTDRQENSQNLKSVQTDLNQMQSLVQNRQALSARALQTDNIIRQNAGIPEVVRHLGDLAINCSLCLDEITPGSATSVEHYNKTAVDLKLNGLFPDLRNFLVGIADKLPFVRIRQLALTRKSNETALCDISIELNVFTLK